MLPPPIREALARALEQRFASDPALAEQVQRTLEEVLAAATHPHAVALARSAPAGTETSLAPTRAEVTVLFADVRGFVPFASEHTPAEVVETMDTYLARAVALVHARQGRVGELAGDALVAVFAGPGAAVLAALDLADAFAALGAARRAAGLATLGFGVGLANGSAVTGVLGGVERPSFAIMGPAVSMASSVQAQAAVGELVATEAVVLAVADLAEVRAELLGYRVIKGTGQIQLYRLARA